jgi:hypothetical protein
VFAAVVARGLLPFARRGEPADLVVFGGIVYADAWLTLVALHCDAWEVVDVEGIETKRSERCRVSLVRDGEEAESTLLYQKAAP